MFFSATDTTKQIVSRIADTMLETIGGEADVNRIDFTLPEARKNAAAFTSEDIVLVGVPVYAGRVPNVLVQYLNTIKGNGALAIAVVVYGNRDYDDALIELRDILAAHDFIVIAGAAFVGEHAFSRSLGAKRPDEKDMKAADKFANQICSKMNTQVEWQTIAVRGNIPYRKYYVPKKENGEPVYDFRLIHPQTNEDCIDCKLCAEVCPMGSICFEDVAKINGICIKCCACIKKCPVQAKYIDDRNFLRHKHELEMDYTLRKEPEIFI